MHLGKIGIAADRGELGHKVNALEQCLVGILRVGIRCIIIQRDRTGLQFIHEVPGRVPQNIVDQEIAGQVIAVGETLFEIGKLRAVRQIAEQEQKYGLFISAVMLSVL